ncbi:MAG: hypothetical protein HN347_16145 [Bacteroidetes bacterium]|jgi:hypothetical protein|nr:hypothetical protein [Bacteroidota bacterium]
MDKIDECLKLMEDAKAHNKKFMEISENLDKFEIDWMKKWYIFLSIATALLIFIFGYTVTTFANSKNNLSRDEARLTYISREEQFVKDEVFRKSLLKIMLMEKADVNDSIIIESFKNLDYLLNTIFGINPRTTQDIDYPDIIDKIK